MILILTRHGETEENLAGIFQGQLHGTLSQKGKDQAKKLALRLKNEKIDIIYSSDLRRSIHTAKAIGYFHPDTPLEFTPELRERHAGEFQGKKKSDFGWDPKRSRITHLETKEGETLNQLHGRAQNFLEKILKKHPQDAVLVVGHGGLNKALIAALRNKAPHDIPEMESFHNTSVTIIEVKEDKSHHIHLFNCTKHLE